MDDLNKIALSAADASRLRLSHAWLWFQGNNHVRRAAEQGKKHASFHVKYDTAERLDNFLEAAKRLEYNVRLYIRKDGSKTVTLKWK